MYSAHRAAGSGSGRTAPCSFQLASGSVHDPGQGIRGPRMRALSPADSSSPTPACQTQPPPPPAWRPLSHPLLREGPSDLITSNHCPDCCLGLRSNRSAAVSPKQVNLSRLDTVSDARPRVVPLGNQRQQAGPRGSKRPPAPRRGRLSLRFKARPENTARECGPGQACVGGQWPLKGHQQLTARLPGMDAVRAAAGVPPRSLSAQPGSAADSCVEGLRKCD